MYVIGKLSELILGNDVVTKYEDPRNPTVTIHIGGVSLPNTLIELGAAINIITKVAVELLINLRPTRTILELADRSKV